MLPIEEVMKVNFSRLTTSHHGEISPSLSTAKREPQIMKIEQKKSESVRLTNGSQ